MRKDLVLCAHNANILGCSAFGSKLMDFFACFPIIAKSKETKARPKKSVRLNFSKMNTYVIQLQKNHFVDYQTQDSMSLRFIGIYLSYKNKTKL